MATFSVIKALKMWKFLRNATRRCSDFQSHRKKCINSQVSAEKKDEHIYRKCLKESDAVDEIVNGVVYQTDDIIVTNKPYGVGIERPIRLLQNYVPQTFTEVYLKDILSEIAKRLGHESLWLVMAPERLASGVTIFTTKEVGVQNIKKGLRRSETQLEPLSYLAVTVGHPTKKMCSSKFGLQIVEENNKKIPTIVDSWTKISIKKKEVLPFRWKHEVVSESQLASLVRINVSKSKKSNLRLTLATKFLSPILGDHVFSCRVLNLFGVPVLVNPDIATSEPQILNPAVLTELGLELHELNLIPTHLHLESIILHLEKNVETIFSVPPPNAFMWTCEKLNLVLNEDNQCRKKSVSICQQSK